MRNSTRATFYFLLAVSIALLLFIPSADAQFSADDASRHRRRHSGEDAQRLAVGERLTAEQKPPVAPSWLAPGELAQMVAEPMFKRGITLPCRASGNPPPEITWTKDGVNVEKERRTVDPHGLLKVCYDQGVLQGGY